MIKFFRKIRYDLMVKNTNDLPVEALAKTGKYLKYAFGEIILVVIGILIALQINDWNSNRLEKNNIANYYKRIIIELDEETKKAEFFKVNLDATIYKNKRALKIIDSKNADSINALKSLLGATVTLFDLEYQFPITKEFIDQNYLSKIKNEKVAVVFDSIAGLLIFSEKANDYSRSQYVNTIEPFFIKNINYSEVALPQFRESIVQGGPTTNYESLFKSLELWNIITFKLENLTSASLTLDYSIGRFTVFKEILEKELENYN